MELNRCFLFKGLSDDQIKKITAVATDVSMEDGQEIFKDGEEAQALYIVKTGSVELLTKVENGIELPICLLRNPGDMFGSGVLVPPHRYTLTARCAGKGIIFRIEGAALKKLIREDRDLGCIIMTNLAEHFLNRLKESRQEIKIHFKTLLRAYRS